jgi:hypothetical protein
MADNNSEKNTNENNNDKPQPPVMRIHNEGIIKNDTIKSSVLDSIKNIK